MVPKGLNYLNTDYEISNIPDFYNDYKEMKKSGMDINPYKYNGDKLRELGYDVMIPDGGDYEWVILNPESTIVLGSTKDIKRFLRYSKKG